MRNLKKNLNNEVKTHNANFQCISTYLQNQPPFTISELRICLLIPMLIGDTAVR